MSNKSPCAMRGFCLDSMLGSRWKHHARRGCRVVTTRLRLHISERSSERGLPPSVSGLDLASPRANVFQIHSTAREYLLSALVRAVSCSNSGHVHYLAFHHVHSHRDHLRHRHIFTRQMPTLDRGTRRIDVVCYYSIH